jgi:hypothetical protein
MSKRVFTSCPGGKPLPPRGFSTSLGPYIGQQSHCQLNNCPSPAGGDTMIVDLSATSCSCVSTRVSRLDHCNCRVLLTQERSSIQRTLGRFRQRNCMRNNLQITHKKEKCTYCVEGRRYYVIQKLPYFR